MINVSFVYNDGTSIDCGNVISMKNSRSDIIYSGDQILSGYYPLAADYYLKSDDAVYSVSCKDLKGITVFKR